MTHPVHGRIDGPIVIIGFGSIGRGVLPLIERHFAYDRTKLTVIDPVDTDRELLERHRVNFVHQPVTRDNYKHLLGPLLTAGPGQGFCVNLSVDTSSLDIMEYCREIGALYIDTVVEPWLGFYFDKSKGPEARSNYALRETVLAARRNKPGGTTAVSCCGANPGMVSWLVKQALLNLQADLGVAGDEPKSREAWAALAQTLGVKGIHIAERDTQRARNPKPRGTFVNTWSVEGFVSEGLQPAELGWGTHEKWMPQNGRTHETGCRRGDLPDAARRKHARALLDADRAGAVRLPGDAQRVDLDRRFPDRARCRRQGRVPADVPLRLSPVRRRRAVAARDVRAGRRAPAALA